MTTGRSGLTHCNTLQHTAIHCKTQCNTLQHTSTHCKTPHASTHWQWLLDEAGLNVNQVLILDLDVHQGDGTAAIFQGTRILQHTATHCITLQDSRANCNALQRTATHGNTRQHTATHGNTLHHAAAHCTTLQHTLEDIATQYHPWCAKRMCHNAMPLQLTCKIYTCMPRAACLSMYTQIEMR